MMPRLLSDPIGLAKAILWQEAKGKLRALVAAEGAQEGRPQGIPRFQIVSEKVEAFITDFEDNGMHE